MVGLSITASMYDDDAIEYQQSDSILCGVLIFAPNKIGFPYLLLSHPKAIVKNEAIVKNSLISLFIYN